MTELARDIFDKLDAFLRSVAPGFVVLVALRFADPNNIIGVSTLFQNEFRLVALGVLLGIISYALHLSLLEDFWMRLVLWAMKKRYSNEVPDWLPEKRRDVMRMLVRERWARSVSEDRRVAAIQAGLYRAYPWLVFLYSSGYMVLAGTLWFVWKIGFIHHRFWPLLASVIVFLGAGVVTDIKATRHEMWLIKWYPQFDYSNLQK